jgi:ABC-type Zn uptake system ZnuABC Zn-binding protein ZnuA
MILISMIVIDAYTLIATVPSLTMIARPILSDWDIESLMPSGVNPAFWKPLPQQVRKAIEAELFVQTAHWPFEIQIAQERTKIHKLTLPEITIFGDPAVEIAIYGFDIIRMPNGDLNPHGWWLYYPNAVNLMYSIALEGCSINPSACFSYLEKVKIERMRTVKVLDECYRELVGKKVVVILPIEEYAVKNFGIKTIKIVQSKGAIVTGKQLREVLDALKKSDGLVISELSKNIPVSRVVVNAANRIHLPIAHIEVMWGEWKSYHEYLEKLCEALRVLR